MVLLRYQNSCSVRSDYEDCMGFLVKFPNGSETKATHDKLSLSFSAIHGNFNVPNS